MKPKRTQDRYRNWETTGNLICEFIERYQEMHNHQPRWLDITDHLMDIGHPTSQGRAWRQSSAQAMLARYCEKTGKEYPLRRTKGHAKNGDEIIITLKITVSANSNIKVKVE